MTPHNYKPIHWKDRQKLFDKWIAEQNKPAQIGERIEDGVVIKVYEAR